jgi:hypothetical protein
MEKNYKFNARYRTAVATVMEEMGLTYISTKRRTNNGTLMFNDPITDCIYAFYESGYCRRLTPRNLHWGVGDRINDRGYAMYQLNPVYKEKQLHKTSEGKYYERTSTKRHLLNPMEQLGCVVMAITNYREKYGN